VLRFFGGDALEHRTCRFVFAVLQRLGRLERGQRLSDAALAHRADHDCGEVFLFELSAKAT
jgi:hypothetical protein